MTESDLLAKFTDGSFMFALSAAWEMVWHFGIGIGILVCGFLWAWFMPVGKKLGLLIAIIAGWGLISYAIGVADDKRKWKAAEAQVVSKEDVARDKAVVTVRKSRATRSVRHDEFDR